VDVDSDGGEYVASLGGFDSLSVGVSCVFPVHNQKKPNKTVIPTETRRAVEF